MNNVSPTLARIAACGDVEEANAVVGAAISTDSMAHEFDLLLGSVQKDLLDLAADLADPDMARVDRARVARLDTVRDQYAPTDPPPPGSHVLAGTSDAAGLLRLARAVTRRAQRSVRALAAADPKASPLPAAYLNSLAELLLVVAIRVEREDPRNMVMGSCADRPLHPA